MNIESIITEYATSPANSKGGHYGNPVWVTADEVGFAQGLQDLSGKWSRREATSVLPLRQMDAAFYQGSKVTRAATLLGGFSALLAEAGERGVARVRSARKAYDALYKGLAASEILAQARLNNANFLAFALDLQDQSSRVAGLAVTINQFFEEMRNTIRDWYGIADVNFVVPILRLSYSWNVTVFAACYEFVRHPALHVMCSGPPSSVTSIHSTLQDTGAVRVIP